MGLERHYRGIPRFSVWLDTDVEKDVKRSISAILATFHAV